MDRIVGWLGWLGSSDFDASARSLPAGGALTFSATLRNDGPEPVTAVFSNPLPAGFSVVPDSLVGGVYDGTAIGWQGVLSTGEEHLLTYAGVATETFTNTAVISYSEHGLASHRAVQVWVNAPDLSCIPESAMKQLMETALNRGGTAR